MTTAAQGTLDEPASTQPGDRDTAPDATHGRVVAWGLTGPDLLILGLVALLCVATLPPTLRPFWAPRTALLTVAAGAGLVLLARHALTRDRAAFIAFALLAWGVLAAVFSSSPFHSLFGEIGTDNSVLFLAAIAACWALGLELSTKARDKLPIVLVVGLGVSGLIGLLQVLDALEGVLAGRFDGRASGLTDNPVQFGPLMAGGAVLMIAVIPRLGRWWTVLPVLAYFAMCVNLSGTRIALVALIVGGVAAGRHLPRMSRLAVVAALLAGFVIGSLVPGSLSAGSRLRDDVSASTPVSGITPRVEAWRAAGPAVAERPMLGHGPGQFHAAATPHLPAAFARAEGPDRVFSDAHNVVVEFGVSTGVPGAVLLVTFAIMLMRRARGPLALFGMTVAITWLLEPMSPNTAPLALLSIGAADVRVATLRAPVGPRTTRALIGLFATAGFFAATAIVIGDVKVYQARVNDSPEQLSAAERWVPRSAFISAMRANHYVRAALINQDESAGQEAIRAAERTVRLRSEHHGNWVRLGDIESFFGSDEDAVPYYREALERYPWSESAWRGLAVAATRLDDGALLREANEHLCLLASPLCDQISVDPP